MRERKIQGPHLYSALSRIQIFGETACGSLCEENKKLEKYKHHSVKLSLKQQSVSPNSTSVTGKFVNCEGLFSGEDFFLFLPSGCQMIGGKQSVTE